MEREDLREVIGFRRRRAVVDSEVCSVAKVNTLWLLCPGSFLLVSRNGAFWERYGKIKIKYGNVRLVWLFFFFFLTVLDNSFL